MSKKNRPYFPAQVNQPQKPIGPSNVGQQFLGQKAVVSVETKTTHTGPIPSPEIIAGYERVLVGAADRIVKMAEKEQDHRHRLQFRNLRYQAGLTLFGQIAAFIMGLSGIGGGIFLVTNDKSIAGFSVFFTSLAVLVGVYIYNRRNSPTPKAGDG